MMIVAFSKVGLAAFRLPPMCRQVVHLISQDASFLLVPLRLDFLVNWEHENELRSLHESWMAKYGRVYKTPEDKEMRFQLFKGVVANACEKYPAAAVPELLEHLNGMADYADKEFKLRCGGRSLVRDFHSYKRRP